MHLLKVVGNNIIKCYLQTIQRQLIPLLLIILEELNQIGSVTPIQNLKLEEEEVLSYSLQLRSLVVFIKVAHRHSFEILNYLLLIQPY